LCALVALVALHALVALNALRSLCALVALIALRTDLCSLRPLRPLIALRSLRTLRTTHIALRPLTSLRALRSLSAADIPLHALIALHSGITLRALGSLCALITLIALRALNAHRALSTLCALITLIALRPRIALIALRPLVAGISGIALWSLDAAVGRFDFRLKIESFQENGKAGRDANRGREVNAILVIGIRDLPIKRKGHQLGSPLLRCDAFLLLYDRTERLVVKFDFEGHVLLRPQDIDFEAGGKRTQKCNPEVVADLNDVERIKDRIDGQLGSRERNPRGPRHAID
jgi:hypothetical protein